MEINKFITKAPTSKLLPRQIGQAINNAGATDLSRSVVAKKAGFDLLEALIENAPEGFAEYEQEKAAGLPVNYNVLYRHGGGVIGGAAAYNSARNDGQGTFTAMGLGAIGATAGAWVGRGVGRQVATHQAGAAGRNAFHQFTNKAYDLQANMRNLNTAEGRAGQHIANQKAKLTQKGENLFETGKNVFTGLKTYAHEGLHALSGNKMTNVEKARSYHNFGGEFDAANKDMFNQRNALKREAQSNRQAYSSHAQLKGMGANLEKLYTDIHVQGGDAAQLLNRTDYHTNPMVQRALKQQGIKGSGFFGMGRVEIDPKRVKPIAPNAQRNDTVTRTLKQPSQGNNP